MRTFCRVFFLLVYILRQLLLVDELTQSGKHTADAHTPENGLGGGVSIDFTDEVEVAEGCEVLQQGDQMAVEGEQRGEG